jgi:hypothetical protein
MLVALALLLTATAATFAANALMGTDANGQKFTDMTYYDKQH